MIKVVNLSHQFAIGKRGKERIVPVLHDINLQVNKGEIVSIIGRSGSGKSTLLNLISGYIRPTAGTIKVDNREVTHFTEGEWADFRLQYFGFVFQSFQLIQSMNAFANVELPLILQGVNETERAKRTSDILDTVGLSDFSRHYPGELSGGQQQRVGIARALVTNPPIILADEPTGSLDSENEQDLLQFIQMLNRERGITFLMITHDDQVASIGHRTVAIQDGRLLSTKEESTHAHQR